MLSWALTFLVVALIAAVFGFGGVVQVQASGGYTQQLAGPLDDGFEQTGQVLGRGDVQHGPDRRAVNDRACIASLPEPPEHVRRRFLVSVRTYEAERTLAHGRRER